MTAHRRSSHSQSGHSGKSIVSVTRTAKSRSASGSGEIPSEAMRESSLPPRERRASRYWGEEVGGARQTPR